MSIQDWFPLGWTGWISLQSKGLSRVFSNTIVQKHQFFSTQLSLCPTLISIPHYWKSHSFDFGRKDLERLQWKVRESWKWIWLYSKESLERVRRGQESGRDGRELTEGWEGREKDKGSNKREPFGTTVFKEWAEKQQENTEGPRTRTIRNEKLRLQ